jgi:starvation-inducible DNA-binding protein
MKSTSSLAFATRNTLAGTTRENLIPLLNARLADAIDLQLQAKQAHWNVKGPQFIALHELFDDLFAEATEWVDLIAERVVQLGGIAEGSLHLAAGRSELPRYPLKVANGRGHVTAIAESLAELGSRVRSAIDSAEAAGDAATADLLTEIARGTDKMLWFVESHLQADA